MYSISLWAVVYNKTLPANYLAMDALFALFQYFYMNVMKYYLIFVGKSCFFNSCILQKSKFQSDYFHKSQFPCYLHVCCQLAQCQRNTHFKVVRDRSRQLYIVKTELSKSDMTVRRK